MVLMNYFQNGFIQDCYYLETEKTLMISTWKGPLRQAFNRYEPNMVALKKKVSSPYKLMGSKEVIFLVKQKL